MRYEITTTESGMKITEVLRRRMGFSARLLRSLKLNGGVTVNGRPRKLYEVLQAGDVVEVAFPKEKSHFLPQDIPIQVLN